MLDTFLTDLLLVFVTYMNMFVFPLYKYLTVLLLRNMPVAVLVLVLVLVKFLIVGKSLGGSNLGVYLGAHPGMAAWAGAGMVCNAWYCMVWPGMMAAC